MAVKTRSMDGKMMLRSGSVLPVHTKTIVKHGPPQTMRLRSGTYLAVYRPRRRHNKKRNGRATCRRNGRATCRRLNNRVIAAANPAVNPGVNPVNNRVIAAANPAVNPTVDPVNNRVNAAANPAANPAVVPPPPAAVTAIVLWRNPRNNYVARPQALWRPIRMPHLPVCTRVACLPVWPPRQLKAAAVPRPPVNPANSANPAAVTETAIILWKPPTDLSVASEPPRSLLHPPAATLKVHDLALGAICASPALPIGSFGNLAIKRAAAIERPFNNNNNSRAIVLYQPKPAAASAWGKSDSTSRAASAVANPDFASRKRSSNAVAASKPKRRKFLTYTEKFDQPDDETGDDDGSNQDDYGTDEDDETYSPPQAKKMRGKAQPKTVADSSSKPKQKDNNSNSSKSKRKRNDSDSGPELESTSNSSKADSDIGAAGSEEEEEEEEEQVQSVYLALIGNEEETEEEEEEEEEEEQVQSVNLTLIGNEEEQEEEESEEEESPKKKKKKKKRLAATPPLNPEEQMDCHVRDKVSGLANPMRTLQIMSTPASRSPYFTRPANPTDEQNRQLLNEKTYPHTAFGCWAMTNQEPNQNGGKTGNNLSGQMRLVVWAPSEHARIEFQNTTPAGVVLTIHLEYDDWFEDVFGRPQYEMGKKLSARQRKKVGVQVPAAMEGMFAAAATSQYKMNERKNRAAELKILREKRDDARLKEAEQKRGKKRARK